MKSIVMIGGIADGREIILETPYQQIPVPRPDGGTDVYRQEWYALRIGNVFWNYLYYVLDSMGWMDFHEALNEGVRGNTHVKRTDLGAIKLRQEASQDRKADWIKGDNALQKEVRERLAKYANGFSGDI